MIVVFQGELKTGLMPWKAYLKPQILGHDRNLTSRDPTSSVAPSTRAPVMTLSQTSQPREQRHLPRLLTRQLARFLLEEPARKRENRRGLPLGSSSASNRALHLRLPDRRRPGDELFRLSVGQSCSVRLELLPSALLVRRMESAFGGRGNERRARRAAAAAVEHLRERRA